MTQTVWLIFYHNGLLEKSRDIDQSVFDEMIDIFGSKVLSKLKKKDRKQPDCSQERGFLDQKIFAELVQAISPV